MGVNEGLDLLGLPSPNAINGVQIPRRRRSCSAESKPRDEAMWEGAMILMAMANGGFSKMHHNNNKTGKSISPATKKQRKKRRSEMKLPGIPPEMPAAMRDRIEEIGGYGVQLVIQKQLQDTDLNTNHGRLSLPPKKVRIDFVTEEETKALDEQDRKNKKGMEVAILDPALRQSSIRLKKWKIGSSHVFCLTTNWNSFVEENDLTNGDCIQLWCFRKACVHPQTGTIASHRLCFAMVKLDISQCV